MNVFIKDANKFVQVDNAWLVFDFIVFMYKL